MIFYVFILHITLYSYSICCACGLELNCRRNVICTAMEPQELNY